MDSRITIEPGKRSGQPCIRRLRITVWDVLGWLGSGLTEAEILDDYPELEPADFRAVYEYAASLHSSALGQTGRIGDHDIAHLSGTD